MNESAFPWQIDNGETVRGHKGMTLRDYFAAKAMQEFIGVLSLKDGTIKAYEWANAMMKEREA